MGITCHSNTNFILSNIVPDLTGTVTCECFQCPSALKSTGWDSNFCSVQIFTPGAVWKESIHFTKRVKYISRLVAVAKFIHPGLEYLTSDKHWIVLAHIITEEMLALTALVLLGSTHTHVAFFFHIECLFCCYNLIVQNGRTADSYFPLKL